MAKPTSWDRKACRNAPCMFGHPICLDTPNICLDDPLYVLMMFGCPIHTQHKESMLCQTKGCPYVPIHLDAPYVWMHLLYVFDAPICLDILDAPFMFGCPLYVWKPLYVWMSPLHVWTPPFVWMAQYFWMHPLYVWMPPYVWMPTYMFGFCHMFGCPHPCLWTQYVWIPPYVWITPCMFGCP